MTRHNSKAGLDDRVLHEIEPVRFGLSELIPNHEVTVSPTPEQTVYTVYLAFSDHHNIT